MSSEWVAKLKAVLEEAERAHQAVTRASFEFGQVLQERASELEEGELVDVGFLFKRSSEMLDDARKECNHKLDHVGKVLALRITRRALNDGDERAIARGELASATPDVRMRPTIPRKGTPQYVALLRHFGVSDEMIETGAFTFHWTHLSDWVTRCAADGKKLPAELSMLRPEPGVSYRASRRTKNEED